MTRLYSFMIASVLAALVSAIAVADDLDIYLGAGQDTATYKPNVLFIMDTSGSMSNQDGTGKTRLFRVQQALNQALGSATNINAGLMRFSDYGGPILYPVRDIDAFVQPQFLIPVRESADDAVQNDEGVALAASTLRLVSGTANHTTGLRFTKVDIPRGATITRAVLKFTSTTANTESSNITIYGATHDESAGFSATLAPRTRVKTSANVVWEDNGFPTPGDSISTPDLSAIMSEIISADSWCGGQSLVLLLEGQGSSSTAQRNASSFDQGNGRAPQLEIEYDASTATGCIQGTHTYQITGQDENAEERSNGRQNTGSELTFKDSSNQYVGLRFENINLPQGAIIQEAYLEFMAYQNGTSGNAQMDIQGVMQNSPSDFNPYTRYLLRDKPKTSVVAWRNIAPWYRNNTYQSPSIKTVIQDIVDRSGWQNGNDLMLVLSNFGSGKRGAYTFNGRPSGAAKLVITYEAQAQPNTAATVRQLLQSQVDGLTHDGMTPIVDTLYEATLYYGGRNIDYGRQRGPSYVSNNVRRSTRVSHRLSYVGADALRPSGCSEDNLSSSSCVDETIPAPASYISPVADLQCQTNNHIVLLSDGQANNNHSVSKIENMLGQSCSGSGGERCGIDLVDALSQSNTSPIDARVVTHTIGFAANTQANNFLNQLALKGGGGFYQTDDADELVDAFQQILRTVKDVNATFVSPGVAVNQLNRLTHKDELYFALFKPAEGAQWPGNLKKYKIDGTDIVDQNGREAVDATSGFFSEYAHSYWSGLPDGADVRQGGAASRLGVARNLYVVNGPGLISDAVNQLHESNNNINAAMLGLEGVAGNSEVRDTVLKWARGVDVRDFDGDGNTTEARLQMGDPIHSQPVIVNYDDGTSVVFVATNHGFLHAIDASTGNELYGLIPQSLLSNLYDFYQDSSVFNHIYGLDGDLVLRHFDDKTYLYVGMRRGGSRYFAFDVTVKDAPRLVFEINNSQPDFAQLGQTWSRPTMTKMQIGEQSKDVMIIGGGYDDAQDDKLERSADAQGNAVYIVDANTGAKLFSIGLGGNNVDLAVPEMQFAIPAKISSVDRDKDGYVDHLYVLDIVGQLFRFDIYNGRIGTNLVKGQRIAGLGGIDASHNRRFFYGPDITEVVNQDGAFYAVTLGSGHRGDPLNLVINDRFFMLKDREVFQRDEQDRFTFPSSMLTAADLYNASEHLLTSANNLVRESAMSNFMQKRGWYIELPRNGEKVLASPMILDYQILFTTYVPALGSDSLCAPPTGNARVYLLDLLTGNAVTDLDGDSEIESDDRSAQLQQTGIAPDSKILVEQIAQPVLCLGAECASAVFEYDNSGSEIQCQGQFACLVRNIYGRFERVKQHSWHSEIEQAK